jgi:hypothetical protein
MKEKVEKLKTQLAVCAKTMSELASQGVIMTFSVTTVNKSVTFTAGLITEIEITSAKVQTDL